MLGRVRKLVFGISARETTFERRGFRGGASGAREHLERIGPAFVEGYHAALQLPHSSALVQALDAVPLELRGFAFEGAAMGLALLDFLTPWNRSRLIQFIRGPADPHTYMAHIGAGWLLARLPLGEQRLRSRFDPVLGWLTLDGYGFHQGFFHAKEHVERQTRPKLSGYASRVFDQGLGRSLWFANGADVVLVARTIAAFAPDRQSDLWSGVGLACTYAGGFKDEGALHFMRQAAETMLPELAQGAAFAAKARERAGNMAEHTRVASRVLCALPAEEAAAITDAALENLPTGSNDEPAYAVWRKRIQERFTQPRILRP